MSAIKEDKTRENRIEMEIIVDANDEEEQAMGWYYYLEDKGCFPFQRTGKAKRGLVTARPHLTLHPKKPPPAR